MNILMGAKSPQLRTTVVKQDFIPLPHTIRNLNLNMKISSPLPDPCLPQTRY